MEVPCRFCSPPTPILPCLLVSLINKRSVHATRKLESSKSLSASNNSHPFIESAGERRAANMFRNYSWLRLRLVIATKPYHISRNRLVTADPYTRVATGISSWCSKSLNCRASLRRRMVACSARAFSLSRARAMTSFSFCRLATWALRAAFSACRRSIVVEELAVDLQLRHDMAGRPYGDVSRREAGSGDG